MRQIKSLLLSMLLFNSFCNGQNKCDSGYSWMPSMTSSAMRIEANKCLPDSICKRYWYEFDKINCGEGSFSYSLVNDTIGIVRSYSNDCEWDDSTGCNCKQSWRIRKGGILVEVTKSEYDKDEKLYLSSKKSKRIK